MTDMETNTDARAFDQDLDAGEPVELTVNVRRSPSVTAMLYTVDTGSGSIFNTTFKSSTSREVWGMRTPANVNL